nr:unnamed protein product [Callosobruchus chinensis]
MACCVLDNFLMKPSSNTYSPPNSFDQENLENGAIALGLDTTVSNMENLERRSWGNISIAARNIREQLMKLF